MTLHVNGYDVKITAKRNDGNFFVSENYNKEDTMRFLLDIACLAWDAHSWLNMAGCHATAKQAHKTADDIHNYLESKGYLDDAL